MSFKSRKRAALPLTVFAGMLMAMMVVAQVAPAVTKFVRPKSATPFQTSLVVAHDECVPGSVEENGTHNTANLAGVSCIPERKTSAVITHGSLPLNSQTASFQGNIKLVVKLAPGADVLFPSAVAAGTGLVTAATAGSNYLQDVRCGPGNVACAPGTAAGWTGPGTGDDYAGVLLANALIRITDENVDANGGLVVYDETGTTKDISFSVPIKCTPNAVATIGSFCTPLAFAAPIPGAPVGGVTSANSICACVADLKRSNIEVSQIQVFDGGTDGSPATSPGDNRAMARQGIFIP